MEKNNLSEEEFTEELYEEAEEQIKEVYKKQLENRDDLLKEIVMIMLSYEIIDNFMNLSRKDRAIEYSKIKNIIKEKFNGEVKHTNDVVKSILKDSTQKKYSYYANNNDNIPKKHDYHGNKTLSKEELSKIINKKIEGMTFSDRIWGNSKEIAEDVQKEIKDFIYGKVNVNQIKSHIIKKYNTNASNVERLVVDQIAKAHKEVVNIRFKEMGVKRIRYNARLCRTCEECMQYHDKVYPIDDAPEVNRHIRCACFWTIEE